MSDRHPTMTSQTTNRDLAEVVAAIRRGDQNLATDFAAQALRRGFEHPLIFLLEAERREKEGFGQQALGLLEQAVCLLDKGTSEVPDEADFWKRIGEMLVRQRMLPDALEAFEAALAIDPNVYLVLIAAGAASYQMGDLKAAYGYYRRAADLNPDEAELLETLALIQSRMGATKEARVLAEDRKSVV